ncbi:caspase-7-like isoform X2 [Tubulanus polymorphus]
MGKDCNTVRVEELIEPFKGNACEALAGKPKLFFIQACRGDGTDGGVVADSMTIDANEGLRIPNEADVLIAYATIPGYVAWRKEEEGSCYIQTLCEVLKEPSRSLDLVKMLTLVGDKVAKKVTKKKNEESKQMPCYFSSLRKDLYFSRKS